MGKARQPPTHCQQCGQPFTEQRWRYPRRWICCECFWAYCRLKSRWDRLLYTAAVFLHGSRYSESGDLKLITGRERLLRNRRIARYTRCVQRGVPIEYEPPADVFK